MTTINELFKEAYNDACPYCEEQSNNSNVFKRTYSPMIEESDESGLYWHDYTISIQSSTKPLHYKKECRASQLRRLKENIDKAIEGIK